MSRACGACTLCCKVMGIKALDKPRDVWCSHASRGGCSIYADRPEECRTFSCLWLLEENLGPEWKPDKSKLVLTVNQAGRRNMVYVDVGSPDAWRRAPYHQRLMAMMQAGLSRGWLTFIVVGERTGLLLPDRLEDMGQLGAGDEITLNQSGPPFAPRYEVLVKRGAEPSAAR